MERRDPFLFGTQRINERGHLEIGGCDTVELAREFGTPLYVLDEALVRETCREYMREFGERLERVEIAYAGKALLVTALCRLVMQEGLALDVASPGELYTALKAEFPTSRIKMHGNFKSDMALEMALDYQVGRVVADSLTEMERLSRLAEKKGKQADILIRVGPGIKTQTHTYIQTGQADSKFGLGIASGAALEGIKLALSLPGLNLRGLHCHIGSQLFGLDSFARTVEMMLDFIQQVTAVTGWECDELDLGGGLGIAYTPEDAPPTVAELADVICPALKEGVAARGMKMPKLILEPGRSIVGPAGTTLYTVGPIKTIPGVRTYVAVDGGLSDNPRPALYEAEYTAIIANKANEPATTPVRVCGAHCETDTLIPETALQPVEEGDILAVFCTGAYNHAMASNYNRFRRPAMVLVANGQADLIYRRETLDDLVAHDVIPDRLR
jgi:diaminopimelate decarboxylase